ncbi:anti-sigma factor family protein [Duganella radicis]|uniref:Anti-sigma factor n=1 Tax=Duganella radicis TaxID=551988 RepID=A0A6L6PN21_9BURK|nr:anti-sigma factor [Duganella radicis]MTV40312.1 anti-sigma factor [Duganella radicis]
MNAPVTEAELQAWVDDRLAPERRAAVDAWLAHNPAEAGRVHAYRAQNAALRALFDPVLDQPLPPTLASPPPAAQARTWPAADDSPRVPPTPRPWPAGEAGERQAQPWPALRLAAMLALTLAGGAAGWWLHDLTSPAASPALQAAAALPGRAAVAHAVYTPEVRHPVEVGADQQAHLVAWLSKRLGAPLKAPQLSAQGWELEGGRLLPGQSGPVAQLMYRDAGGARLTLYVSTEQTHNRDAGFRFAQEGEVSVFYWIDGKFGYALSGTLDKAALATLANAVYAQLEQPGA